MFSFLSHNLNTKYFFGHTNLSIESYINAEISILY